VLLTKGFSDADLSRIAALLDRLVGLLTFGASDSTPSVDAAALARRVYGSMPGDHRLDVAASWVSLSLRHYWWSGDIPQMRYSSPLVSPTN
jgi:hypothetical protein